MTTRIAPASKELEDFYRARSAWRSRGEERMRFAAVSRVASIPAASKVLDIGCRDGGLRAFLPKDIVYQGVDITPEFEAPDIMIRDVSKGLPFADGHFDAVFAIEVLEHVPNPFGALTEIHRVLRPGGIFTLSVPNPFHIKELIWNLFHIPDHQGHIYGWTRQNMTALGAMNGFRLDRTGGTYLHPPIPMPLPLLARSVIYRFVKP